MISPQDAAVAIRSFPRRWQELREGREIDPAVLGRVSGLERRATNALTSAGASLGWPLTGDLPEVASELARHVEESGPDRWRDESLHRALDTGVQDAAHSLREAERLAGTR